MKIRIIVVLGIIVSFTRDKLNNLEDYLEYKVEEYERTLKVPQKNKK